ncbi:hypothetical protein ONE63_000328 [Megalurothrips usitatus]|uniref:Serine/arginine repetitive matrix protein 2-like n=1 Tax=Megalurothrips usitatus TaxID=439358 RepID=A0AAV7XZ58_9NEOP|nr:hypothetical protein ONE63_000328 [Megalurothrips usitatus]
MLHGFKDFFCVYVVPRAVSLLQGYLAAVRDNKDVRRALLSGQEVVRGQDGQLVAVDPRGSGPRLVHQSSKGRKVVDTENTHEVSELQPDGRVVTEKRRTTEHEEVDEKEDPDDGELDEEDKYRESKQRFRKSKDQELVEYVADGVKIGEEMRYQCENVEGERFGDPQALALEDQQEWDSLSARIRRMRRDKLLQRAAGQLGPAAAAAIAADRKDALTKRPLDFDQEEETRKVETSKWLEHHFGSESRSSKDSIEDEDDVQRGTTTSFINVTMKSRPVAQRTNGLLNGHQHNTSSSSRVFVSSPEPRPESPYFQGISQWSERRQDQRREQREQRHDTRETSWNKKSTFSPSDPTSAAVGSGGYTGRPDRVQVLPTGPDHTFKTTTTTTTTTSAPTHVNGGTRLYKTTSTHRRSPSSPYRDSPTYRDSPYRDDSDELPPHEYAGGRGHFAPNVNAAFLERERLSSERAAAPGRYTPSRDKSPSPPQRNKYSAKRYHEEDEVGYRGSGSALRKKDSFREWPPSSPEYHHHHSSSHHRGASPSPSPPPMPANKKLYQRTRFAADIPPPSAYSTRHPSTPTPPPTTTVKTQQQSASQIIGDSFRKLVGKFRSGSSERKNKASRKLSNKSSGRGGSSRSRSPSPTYRPAEGSLLGLSRSKRSKSGRRSAQDGDGSSPNDGTEEGDSPEEVAPVAPPRHSAGRSGLKRSQSRSQPHRNGDADRDTVDGELRTTRKYYLGEDPFGGSIYGREREYDGVVPARRKQREPRRGSQSEEERHSSLGRHSKSTSRLTVGSTQHNTLLNGSSRRASNDYAGGYNGSQTLPRKLRDRDDSAARAKKQVYVTKSNATGSSSRSSPPQVWEHRFSRERSSPRSSPLAMSPLTASPHTGSLINVSYSPAPAAASTPARNGSVSWESQGPAKPARTYRTSLTRSKSFNVQAAPTAYRSTSQLHRLEESPPPLKSPSILASISRSTRDLTDIGEKENVEDLYTKPRRASEQRRLFSSTSHLNGVNANQDPKKKAFMRGLLDRAPELFKTLHPEETSSDRDREREQQRERVIDYSNSFRSGSSPYRATPTRTASPSGPGHGRGPSQGLSSYRRDSNSGSNGSGDYSETVRITSKCTDPLRPSVTNTVQSFSRRSTPSGRVVETSDTSTVTKSSSRRSGDSGISGLGDTSASSSFLDKYPRHSHSMASSLARHNGHPGVVIEVRNTRK